MCEAVKTPITRIKLILGLALPSLAHNPWLHHHQDHHHLDNNITITEHF